VLSGLKTIRLGIAYRDRTAAIGPLEELPLGPADLSPFQAVYEEMPGWDEDVGGARSFSELPEAAQNYVHRLEALVGLPVSMVSVGPERAQIIWRTGAR
jgi:adenylosuccinate synthase